jgi:hypothetical protein
VVVRRGRGVTGDLDITDVCKVTLQSERHVQTRLAHGGVHLNVCAHGRDAALDGLANQPLASRVEVRRVVWKSGFRAGCELEGFTKVSEPYASAAS